MKSSTEAKLVGADDAMGNILWTSYFLQVQGFKSKTPILYQDNKSVMLLEKMEQDNAKGREELRDNIELLLKLNAREKSDL